MRESYQRQDANSTGRSRCQHLRPDDSSSRAQRFSPRPRPRLARCYRLARNRRPRPQHRASRWRHPTNRSSGTSPTTTSRSRTGSRRRRARRYSCTPTPTTRSPDAVKAFGDEYGVQIEISTFNDTDEAITKIRSGSVNYDLYFPSYDQISRLVSGKLVRPLNHSYIPEHQECVAELHQPLVRPGLALLRAVHHLHHRHRLA